MTPVLAIVRPGLGASIQDRGRPGLARFGVPRGGSMDDRAAACANHLLGNDIDAPVIELLLQGAILDVLTDIDVAIAGADASCTHPMHQRIGVRAGERITFPASRSGLWTYVAIAGGFDAPRHFDSASAYPRGGLGRLLSAGDVLARAARPPAVVDAASIGACDRRDYLRPPILRVWPAPQSDSFETDVRAAFFARSWTVSTQSDRIGFRLDGVALSTAAAQIPSEPVLPGSIQIPPGGQPIVTMRDGPTVGGYPKIGLVDPRDLSWLAQCRPGTHVHFIPIDEDAPNR